MYFLTDNCPRTVRHEGDANKKLKPGWSKRQQANKQQGDVPTSRRIDDGWAWMASHLTKENLIKI